MEANTAAVWYYICTPEPATGSTNDYCIIKVKPADEAGFTEDYGHRIICKDASLMAALLAFEATRK